jgi:chorismate synthase
MAGSTYGTMFRVTTFGESHGEALGAVVDGCPAGLALSEDDLQVFLDRRRPGQSKITTQRKEADRCRILSGVFGGKTTGTPIMAMIENTDQRSADYSEIASYYRPGHADYTYDMKYGFRDYRGGGRSSGRETVGRVIGGAVAARALSELGISVHAYTQSIGRIMADPEKFSLSACSENAFWMPDNEAAAEAEAYVKELMKEKDSAGGVIGCVASGIPAGLGEPVFDKLDAELAKAILSIGAVKGIEFGAGFAAPMMTGSMDNDVFMSVPDQNGKPQIKKKTNNAGGVLGGISDGSALIFQAAVKPTSSISRPQHTVNVNGENIEIVVKGRHDPVIVPRAVVVVESMTNMVLFDLLLRNSGSRMEHLHKIYG